MLVILYGQYFNDLLFVLVSIFYLHGNFKGSPVGRVSLQFLLLIDDVSLAQYRGEIGLFYNRSFAPDLCYMFSITCFIFY